MADVKGDLSGIAAAGDGSEKLLARLAKIGVTDWQAQKNPVMLWDIFGQQGHPVRATVSDLGPLLLARLLSLNEVQSGVLQIIFRIADDQGLLLLDFKDLRAMTQYIGDNAKAFQTQYGNISSASVGAIQRACWRWSSKGLNTSLVNRCWISVTGCAATLTAKASSISWRRKSFISSRNSTPPACCGCWRNCMNSCRKPAIWKTKDGVLL